MQGGFVPAGGQGPDGSDRERRYYLLEDPEVWGTSDTVPSVIYGEFEPAGVLDHDDEDDDDF